jgi:predicted nuclease with TOPRIM domain
MKTGGYMNKAERTRSMRYKRPALLTLGWEKIRDELDEIQEACNDVAYFVNSGDDTLLNALDGDSEEEYEFRIAFSDLEGKVEELSSMLYQSDAKEYFDDCTVGLIGNRYKTVGYDMMQEDYFGLTGYEAELAHTLSGQRMMKHTKQEMLSIIGQCLGIVMAFLDIRHSYDYLKAVFDILRDSNTALLKTIKDIEAAYYAAEKEGFVSYAKETRRFESLLCMLPDIAWIA